MPNNAYSLNIVTSEKTLTASSKTFSEPVLDSLNYLTVPPGFGSTDTTFLLFYNFTDNGDETNFYRVKAWVNGKADLNYYIGDDVLGNGQPASAPIFVTEIKSKDTVHIELLSMDEVDFTITDGALDYIVNKAIEYKLGARGLRSLCEEILTDAMFHLPGSGETKLNVTKTYAEDKLSKSTLKKLKAVS